MQARGQRLPISGGLRAQEPVQIAKEYWRCSRSMPTEMPTQTPFRSRSQPELGVTPIRPQIGRPDTSQHTDRAVSPNSVISMRLSPKLVVSNFGLVLSLRLLSLGQAGDLYQATSNPPLSMQPSSLYLTQSQLLISKFLHNLLF